MKLANMSILAQIVVIKALHKTGYSLQQLINADITSPLSPNGDKQLHGIWKVKTGHCSGFSLNVSKEDVFKIKMQKPYEYEH